MRLKTTTWKQLAAATGVIGMLGASFFSSGAGAADQQSLSPTCNITSSMVFPVNTTFTPSSDTAVADSAFTLQNLTFTATTGSTNIPIQKALITVDVAGGSPSIPVEEDGSPYTLTGTDGSTVSEVVGTNNPNSVILTINEPAPTTSLTTPMADLNFNVGDSPDAFVVSVSGFAAQVGNKILGCGENANPSVGNICYGQLWPIDSSPLPCTGSHHGGGARGKPKRVYVGKGFTPCKINGKVVWVPFTPTPGVKNGNTNKKTCIAFAAAQAKAAKTAGKIKGKTVPTKTAGSGKKASAQGKSNKVPSNGIKAPAPSTSTSTTSTVPAKASSIKLKNNKITKG